MQIKNWQLTKYNTRQYMIWKNTLPYFQPFEKNYMVSVGRVGNTNLYFMSVTKDTTQLFTNQYSTFELAYKSAIAYMRNDNIQTNFITGERINAGTATKEETEEYFLGANPRKHKDYKYLRGQK